MPDTTPLSDFIRYQLSSLNAKNKHHDFEDMCYQYARLAISPNFLPATGPVSSGGDQGRDSETFQSAINFAPPVGSAWAFADGRKAVIACSLEKRVKAKIEGDVVKICKDNKPDFIYFFSNQDIPVAMRHKLQSWCSETYDVTLEIFDIAAIADQLTRLELFWIAQSYLNIPSEMYPRTQSNGHDKYDELYRKWIKERRVPQTFSDFVEIKRGIRKATFNDEKKVDLVDWIKVMQSFPKGSPPKLLRRCTYEICVAALRGMGNLDRYTSLVESYFSDIPDLDADQIEDALTLLGYCSAGLLHRQFSIGPEKVHGWTVELIAYIEEHLKRASSANSKCELLGHRSYAATLHFQKGVEPTIDWNEPFKWWNRLLSEVKNAPLFPLERFSDLLTILAPVIGDDPRYSSLTEKLDDLLGARSQGYVAAEKCRDRAMAFMEDSRPIRAIHELHSAKIKWFTKETIKGTILSLLTLSHLYSSIHLVWAAKYYALAAAYLVHKDNDDQLMRFFPDALIQLFNVCYQGGEWTTCINLLPLVCNAHYQFHSDPENYEKHDPFRSVLAHSIFIHQTNKKIGNEEIEAHYVKRLEDWPLPDDLDRLVMNLDGNGETWISTSTPEQLWKNIDNELDGVPFSDAGQKRTFSWRALGILWQINCTNTPEVIAAVESFVCCLQIVTVDLADKDLVLLPTTVVIDADCFASAKFKLTEVAGNDGSNWKLDVPLNSSSQDLEHWALTFATMILMSCSLLPAERCQSIFEDLFKKGLQAKTFVVRSYHELLSEFAQSDIEKLKQSIPRPRAPDSICSHEAAALSWKSGPGPGYTSDISHERINNRYTNALPIVRHSIAHLSGQKEFIALVAELKRQGYRDWHILLLLANVAMNKRSPISNDYVPSQANRKAIAAAFNREEKEDDAPLEMEDVLRTPFDMQLNMQLSTVCSTWGLHFKSQTPDFVALRSVLVERYGYLADDVPHETIFHAPAEIESSAEPT